MCEYLTCIQLLKHRKFNKSFCSRFFCLRKRVQQFIIYENDNNVKITKALEHQRLCLRSNWSDLNCLFSFFSGAEQSVGLIKSQHRLQGARAPLMPPHSLYAVRRPTLHPLLPTPSDVPSHVHRRVLLALHSSNKQTSRHVYKFEFKPLVIICAAQCVE